MANTYTVFLWVAVFQLLYKILFRLSEKNSHHNCQNLVTTLLLTKRFKLNANNSMCRAFYVEAGDTS